MDSDTPNNLQEQNSVLNLDSKIQAAHIQRESVVVLISNDRIEFNVHIATMIESSSVFAEMFSLSISTSDDSITQSFDTAKPIEISANGQVVDLFIRILNSSFPFLGDINLENIIALLDLCKRFELKSSVIIAVREWAMEKGRKQPWDLLISAADHNDNQLIQYALKKLTWHTFFAGNGNSANPFWTRIGKLKDPWKTQILKYALGDPNLDQLGYGGMAAWSDLDMRDKHRYWQHIMDTRLKRILFEEKVRRVGWVSGSWIYRAACVVGPIYFARRLGWKKTALSFLLGIYLCYKSL